MADLALSGPESRRNCRSRLLRHGAESLGNAELLALWLGLPDSASGEALLSALGGLGPVFRAPVDRLTRHGGLGPARIARLLAGVALMERQALEEVDNQPVMSCTGTVRRFLRTKLAALEREVFGCVFLDSRHRLIRYEALFLGTVDRASIHPRELLRRSLELNAAAVILAHNHPSGIAEPSPSDLTLTQDVVALMAKIDVRVLDHLVVGRGSEVSFAERGLL
jgi:DNA repair protein RadC